MHYNIKAFKLNCKKMPEALKCIVVFASMEIVYIYQQTNTNLSEKKL